MALALAVLTQATQAAEPIVDFTVLRADTLIGLSNSVLVSPSAWREVARLNKLADPNRILPGQVLRIPTRLLRPGAAADATLVSVIGDVRAGDTPAQTGTVLAEGQTLQTAAGSSAVVALADGSRVQVAPSSLAQIAASRTYGARLPAPATATAADSAAAGAPSGWFAGTLRVLRGSVEVFATKVLRAKPLEVVTPTAVVGVRGTHYRVGFDEAANARTHAELIEGAVRFDPIGTQAGADLAVGFGASTSAGAKLVTVAKMLDPPDLSSLAARFERPVVRFTLPGEATPVRVQVAADGAFEKMVSDQVVAPGTEARITGLDDAAWFLRARRIDTQGIEGADTARTFVLKARPEPPAYRAPRSDAKQAAGRIEFAWAPNADAPRTRLQLAQDPEFTRIVQDRDLLEQASLALDISEAGTYHWRMASIRPDGDHGPFGDPQRFEVRPTPEPPKVDRSSDGSSLIFRWSGRSGDRQQVQMSRDPKFTEIVAQAELESSEWIQPMPASGGRYYFRYRSVEPDGYVSPYSETLMLDVPRDWRGWLLLLPALLLL
jgi:hypothetical protein